MLYVCVMIVLCVVPPAGPVMWLHAMYLLLLAARALGDVCTTPGLTVSSFAAYVGSSGAESCVSLHNNACPSAAGATAQVVVLDPFVFVNFPAKPLSASWLTSDRQFLNAAGQARFCDASQYGRWLNIPVAGKWIFQSSFMLAFCERGYSMDLSLTVAEQDAIAQGPYISRGYHLRSLEAAGAAGVTSFNSNFTIVARTEADYCHGVSNMPVTYTNNTYYVVQSTKLRGKPNLIIGALLGWRQGNLWNIRIPSAPAPSPPPPPPPPFPPPSNNVVTIAAISGGAFAGAVLIILVIYAVVRRRKRASATGTAGSGGKPPQPQKQKTDLFA